MRLADVKLADSRDQHRVETPPRVLMKNRAAADKAARAAAAAANGEGAGQASNRSTRRRNLQRLTTRAPAVYSVDKHTDYAAYMHVQLASGTPIQDK